MGNKSGQIKAPSYSFWGLVLGQVFKQKEFTQNTPQKVIDEIKSLNLEGGRYLVTGASTGIGREVSKLLARQGAHVVMVSRSLEKLQQAANEIKSELSLEGKKEPSLSLDTLDLADVDQVVEFCKRLTAEGKELDGLINNGGALHMNQKISGKRNLEESVATHVISPFILSWMLLPLLQKRHGRIIHNSSAGAYTQKLYPELIRANFAPCVKKNSSDLQYDDGAIVYAQAKRAMMEISDQMGELFHKNYGVLVTCVHPGWCQTPGLKPLLDQHESYQKMKFRPALDGAYGVVWCAISHSVQPSEFYFDGEVTKKHQTLAGTQSNPRDQVKIWNYCVEFLPQEMQDKVRKVEEEKKK